MFCVKKWSRNQRSFVNVHNYKSLQKLFSTHHERNRNYTQGWQCCCQTVSFFSLQSPSISYCVIWLVAGSHSVIRYQALLCVVWTFLRNISKNFKKYFLKNINKFFLKNFKKYFLKNFKNIFGKFLNISEIIPEKFEKYFWRINKNYKIEDQFDDMLRKFNLTS